MKQPRITVLCLILCSGPALPAFAQKVAPQGAKVLLLSGGKRQHHGYRDQALYLSGTLENTGRFQVTICEDAAILETPAMNKYDLMIVNADRRTTNSNSHQASKKQSLTTFAPDMATSRSTEPTTPPRIGCPPGGRCSAESFPTSVCPTARPARALSWSGSPKPRVRSPRV